MNENIRAKEWEKDRGEKNEKNTAVKIEIKFATFSLFRPNKFFTGSYTLPSISCRVTCMERNQK